MRRVVVALCLGAMFAGAAVAQQLPASTNPDPESCSVTDRPEMSWDTRWRVQTNEGLDCLVAIVGRALGDAGSGESGDVSVSRKDLERIRELALLSKDAAQRIGR